MSCAQCASTRNLSFACGTASDAVLAQFACAGCCGQRFKRGPRPSAFATGNDGGGEGEGAALAASGDGVGARARFVVEHAGWLAGASEECEQVLGAFTALQGAALFELKRAVDGVLGLHALVHEACGAHAREVLLAHFARCAEQHCGSNSGGEPAHTVVLCDIDDTLWAALHDASYPHGVPYPGCVCFLTELQSSISAADGASGGSAADHSALHAATFLTARPAFLRHPTVRALREATAAKDGAECSSSSSASASCSSLSHSALVMGSALSCLSQDAMLAQKLRRYREVRRLYPEARLIFLGDNGQADALLGERLLAEDGELRACGAPCAHVLIHDVLPSLARDDVGHKTHRTCAMGSGVVTFRTYAGAAHAARAAGLLSAEGLERVAFAVAREIREVPFATERVRQTQQTAVLKDVSVVLQDLPAETALRCMEAIQLM